MATKTKNSLKHLTDDDIFSYRQKTPKTPHFKDFLTDSDVESYLSKKSAPTPKSVDKSTKPRRISKFMSGLGGIAKDTGIEMYKGLQSGAASFSEPLAQLERFHKRQTNKALSKIGAEPKYKDTQYSVVKRFLQDPAMREVARMPETRFTKEGAGLGTRAAGATYRGLGALGPTMLKYAIPSKYLGATAGFAGVEAAEHLDKGKKEVAGAAIKGAALGGVLKGANYLDILKRVPTLATVFGGQTALEQGSPEEIIASTLVGGGLGLHGRIGIRKPKAEAELERHIESQAKSMNELFNIMSVDPTISRIQLQKMKNLMMNKKVLAESSPQNMESARNAAMERLRRYEAKQATPTEGRKPQPEDRSVILQMERAIEADPTATPKEVADAKAILQEYKAQEMAIILDPRPSAKEAENVINTLEQKNHDLKDPETGEVIKPAETLTIDEVVQIEKAKEALMTGDFKPSQGEIITAAQEAVDKTIKLKEKRQAKVAQRGPIKDPTTVIGEVRKQGGVTMKSLKEAGYTWEDIKEFGLMSIINNKSGQAVDSMASEMKKAGEISSRPNQGDVEALMENLKLKSKMLYKQTAKEYEDAYRKAEDKWLQEQYESEAEPGRELQKYDELDQHAEAEAQSEFIQETGGEDAGYDPREVAEESRATVEYEAAAKIAKKKKRQEELKEVVEKKSIKDIIPEPVKRKSVKQMLPPKDIVPKEAPMRTSKLGRSVEASAIRQKLTKSFEGLPEYGKINVDAQVKKAATLLEKDLFKAVDIALGIERPPKGLLPESVFIVVENQALKNKDVETLEMLASGSTLGPEESVMGQRIRMLAERNPYSAVSAIQKARKVLEENYEMTTNTTVEKAKKVEVVEIKKAIKKAKPTKGDWDAFISSISC